MSNRTSGDRIVSTAREMHMTADYTNTKKQFKITNFILDSCYSAAEKGYYYTQFKRGELVMPLPNHNEMIETLEGKGFKIETTPDILTVSWEHAVAPAWDGAKGD